MLKEQLIAAIAKVVPPEYHQQIEITVPPNPSLGDFSTNIALKTARLFKKSPQQIAEDIKSQLGAIESIAKIEVVAPGYINFYLEEIVLWDNVQRILKDGNKYGQGQAWQDKTVMIEYAHPNPFKIMHIGHLRNITLGESLVRLFEFSGAKVIRTNYQGDVGMHVAKCLFALSKVDPDTFPKDVDERVALLGHCYKEGASEFEDNPEAKAAITKINGQIYDQSNPQITELWKTGVEWSLAKFRQIYERVDSHFDREYLESEVLEQAAKEVKEARAKQILVESEGAVVFKGEKYGLDTRVFLNSQGYLTYEGKELGLARMEFSDFGQLDLCVHNVAVEQISFFKVTFKVEELLDPELYQGKQYHNAYEFVGLKSGKMSSRRGQIVPAEDILNEANKRIRAIVAKNKVDLTDEEIDTIAVGAVKYGYLKMSPFKYLAFDLDQSVSFSGDSGPYLQYTYARCQSILRKAGDVNSETTETNQEEDYLLKKLFQFGEVAGSALANYSPHYLAGYLNELAQLFNNFYVQHQVKGNSRRLELTKAVAQVIKNGLYLLGINTVERM